MSRKAWNWQVWPGGSGDDGCVGIYAFKHLDGSQQGAHVLQEYHRDSSTNINNTTMRNASLKAVLRGVSFYASALSLIFGTQIAGHAVPAASDEIGVLAHAFDLSEVRLLDSRWLDNQKRTLNYLLYVDVERLLYNFKANHGLETQGEPVAGWEGKHIHLKLDLLRY
jgi:hypothetical protein